MCSLGNTIVYCAQVFYEALSDRSLQNAVKYTVQVYFYGSATKLISKIPRYGMVFGVSVIVVPIILSSIFKGSFHSFKSWRNLLNPFVFPNLFPQLTFPAPVNFWHSHTINMCENVSSMQSTSLLNLFRCRERYEKRDRGTERINVLIVSRENLV